MWKFEINRAVLLMVLLLLAGCSKDSKPEVKKEVTANVQNSDQLQTKNVGDDKKHSGAVASADPAYLKMKAAPLLSIPGKRPPIPSPPDTSQYGDYFKELGSAPELEKVADKLIPYWDGSLLRKLPKEEIKKLFEFQTSISLKYHNEAVKGKKKSYLEEREEGKAMGKEIEAARKAVIPKQFPEYKAIIKLYKLLLEQRIKRNYELDKVSSHRSVLLKKREQYSIKGVITDEVGELLSDVEMIVHISYDQDIPFLKGISNKKFTVNIPDGKINFRIKPQYGKIKLDFKKKGYYPPLSGIIDISRPLSGTELDQSNRDWILAAKNKIPPILFRKRHKIKVVLDKKGSRAKLTPYNDDGLLTYKTDGSGTVMDFSKPKSKLKKVMREVKNVKETKLLPKHCIVFTAIPNKAGAFPRIYWSAKFKGAPNDDDHPVIEYRLKINDPDPTAGFWMIDPKKEGKYHNDNRISEAPETGYVRELVFGSDQEYQIGIFYIKINGKYGIGVINDNSYTHEYTKNEANCQVYITIQENGTRLLRTGGRYNLSPRLIYKKP